MAQSNLAPLLADVETMTGAASPLLDACNFIATLTERKFTTVQLYLLAATIYVNDCKFALMLVYTSGVPGYLATLSKYKADHPDWRTNPKAAPTYPISFADQQSSIYLHRLRDRLGESLSYAKPIVDELQLKPKTKDDAVENRARDFELKENASGKWYWEDVRQKVSSAPTDKEKASTGMTLAIGMAQAQEEKTQVVTLKLAGVDPGEVTKYRQTIDALDGALQDYPAAKG